MIRADVNAAANWAELLHNVTAAAAVAHPEFVGDPVEDRVVGAHFQQPGKGIECLCYICVFGEEGSLTPQPRFRVAGHC